MLAALFLLVRAQQLMKPSATRNRGQLLADFLAGSWRATQARVDFSLSDFERITTLLYNSGGAGLAWWRIHESDLKTTQCGELLHQGYRLQVLQAGIQQTKIQKVFRLMRASGAEPILLKGWAIARLYPHAALRPYGDIDLFVRRDDYPAAQKVIKSDEGRDCWVDLHARIFELADRDPEGLFSRSQVVPCGDEEVRVLCAEDHFALLAVHMLKHGAWRPLWLCDLGLLLESMPDDFDWKLCLGRSKRRSNWILSAVGLAHQLIGARIGNDEIAARSREIPRWLVPAVLKQWEAPFREAHESLPLMAGYLRRPVGFVREIPNRWPDPIVATVNVRGKFNNYPRVAYQLCEMAARTAKCFWSLPQRSTLRQSD